MEEEVVVPESASRTFLKWIGLQIVRFAYFGAWGIGVGYCAYYLLGFTQPPLAWAIEWYFITSVYEVAYQNVEGDDHSQGGRYA